MRALVEQLYIVLPVGQSLLLDSSGRLIGINTAIISESGSSAGIGFAIPVDLINRVVPQIIQHGPVLIYGRHR